MKSKSAKLNGLKNAWLSPTGKLVDGDAKEPLDLIAWHQDVACAIIRDEQKFKSHKEAFFWVNGLKFNYSPTEYLEDRKWIRLHGFGGLKPVWIVRSWQKITKAQEAIVADWCIANRRTYSEAFCK